jgi:hypothetical protein
MSDILKFSGLSKVVSVMVTLALLVLGGLEFQRMAAALLNWNMTTAMSGPAQSYDGIPAWQINSWF